MSLSALVIAQQRFATMLGQLLVYAAQNNIGVTLGEVWRSPTTATANATCGIGIAHSLHCDRLAADLNVFLDNEYQAGPDGYALLADFWKSLHLDARWGGDFTGQTKGDFGHFSLSIGDGRA